MPQNQTRSNAQRYGRQFLELELLANQGGTLAERQGYVLLSTRKRPRGVERKQLLRPARKSARLQIHQQLWHQN